ncbi:MAG: 2-oxo-hepta-3-ene-1,7-dioic acid hydratase [Rhodobacteraceae bacterium]|nr:2-oxo-hepta-3-ene-1,7-dioic acid hydratase [Paracoccaceae bacterium]
MSDRQVALAALQLHEAERNRRQTDLLSLKHPEMTMLDAYRIQHALIERKVAAGEKPVGYKIGLTSRAMQRALGIEIPDSGALFDTMLVDNGAMVASGRYIEPRIEAEIAFVMKRGLSGDKTSRQDAIDATDHVMPALEILDTRIYRKDPASGTARNVLDTIADNAANAGIVLGDRRHRLESVDLNWVGAIVRRGGEVEETGLGAGVLDDPVSAVVWLARRLGRFGQSIRSGDIILSGSFIRPIEAPPGSAFEADFGSFGRVEVTFG